MKIHIMGASGAGKTFLGKELAKKLNYLFVDTDDIIWKWGDDIIPYTQSVPEGECCKILEKKLNSSDNVIVSGLFYPWGEPQINKFDLLVYLSTPTDVRKERLIKREFDMYGDRCLENGDMYDQFQSFVEWACNYDTHDDAYGSKKESLKWIKKFNCKVLYLDGSDSLESKMEQIINNIINMEITDPTYVVDLNEINKNCQSLKTNLKNCKLYYALKPNNDLKIIDTINNNGFNFEVSSIEEFEMVRKYNKDIICSLPIKSNKLIKYLYENGCTYFVFDSLCELNKIKNNAPNSTKILRIDITEFKDNIMKFGMNFEDFKCLLDSNKLSKDDIDGFTFYLANNYNSKKIVEVMDYLEKYIKYIDKENLIINLGGNYRTESDITDNYYEILQTIINKYIKNYKCQFYAEPGHAIVRSAAKFVTNVISVIKKDDEIRVFIDSGYPHGLYMTPKKIKCINKNKEDKSITKVNFYGMVCDHKLLFTTNLDFEIEEDDKLLFYDYGSYTMCFENSFHGWNKASKKYIGLGKTND